MLNVVSEFKARMARRLRQILLWVNLLYIPQDHIDDKAGPAAVPPYSTVQCSASSTYGLARTGADRSGNRG